MFKVCPSRDTRTTDFDWLIENVHDQSISVKNVLSANEDKVKYVKGFKHWLRTAIYKTSCPLAIHVKRPGFPRRSSAPRLPSHSLVPY